ncbi:MAG: fumarate hydratase C-terminal domain-containing protein [Verrucomicrobia bacterium]|nr:fumarate hydratase C-terminal domain-containing protein [Verrucomicrobiota bacterium]
MSREIQLPLTEQVAVELRAGDEVELTGAVLTGRDQACARLFQMITEQGELPVALAGQLIYFVGPSPARPGQVIGSAGPTTSGRMNPFLPAFLARELRGFIGKGYLGAAVKEALVAHRGVYFGAIGGTGALLSGCIESAQVVAFPELVSEAIHLLRLRRFPAVVLCDSHGGDLYARASQPTGSADGTGADS